MPPAVPTQSAVIDIVVTEIDAILTPVALDDVFGFDQRFTAQWEDLKAFQNLTTGKLDVVYVFPLPGDEVEGRANGQRFPLYNIVADYWNVRVNVVGWSDVGDDVSASILDKLSGDQSVFAIGGQRQILTPETARTTEQGFTTVDDEHGNSHKIYKARHEFQVEARRFG